MDYETVKVLMGVFCLVWELGFSEFDATRAYALSKLANVLHTKELAEILKVIKLILLVLFI